MLFDASIFTTAEAWISLFTLIFLEIVLGIDNIVFIALTTNRLPENKQPLGRKLGLAGAMLMRILFLFFASWLVHMTATVFSLDAGWWAHHFSIRDLVLLAGGVYLVYKGIDELRDMFSHAKDAKGGDPGSVLPDKLIGLPQAIATIMVMDVVFSIDSVITAVGLANHLIIMILAVMIAVFMMMIFIDQISDFINRHVEMKILAVVFIVAIGILLSLDALGITTGIEILDMHLEKLMVYFAMLFALVLEIIQMRYNKRAQRDSKGAHKRHDDDV